MERWSMRMVVLFHRCEYLLSCLKQIMDNERSIRFIV